MNRYVVNVEAVGHHGRLNKQVTTQFLVDKTPPNTVGASVLDIAADVEGLSNTTCNTLACGRDKQAGGNGTSLGFKWAGFIDDESAVDHYLVGIGHRVSADTVGILDAPLVADVVFVNVGLATHHLFTGLSLTNGEGYVGCVTAVNTMNLSSVVCSDGLIMDTQPPALVYLYDGVNEGVDMNTTLQVNIFQANYVAEDMETGVESVWLSFAFHNDITLEPDLGPWVEGINQTYGSVFDGPWVPDATLPVLGDWVYAHAYAVDAAGHKSARIVSSGIKIAPVSALITPGEGAILELGVVEIPKGQARLTELFERQVSRSVLTIPYGAVGNDTRIEAGPLSAEDLVGLTDPGSVAPEGGVFKFAKCVWVVSWGWDAVVAHALLPRLALPTVSCAIHAMHFS